MATVDFVAPFCVCGAGAGHVAFVDDGAVEEVTAEWEMQVVVGVVCEAERLEGGEGVDRCGDVC